MNRALFHSTIFGVLLTFGTTVFSVNGFCQEPKKAEPPQRGLQPKVPESKNPTLATAPDAKSQMTDIQRFCLNNAASAGDARAAWQAAKLMDLEEQVKQRIAELDAKKTEYQEWLRKRDEAVKKAEDGVVAIYSRMRPEAAASQLAAMDDDMAANLLAKLPPRNASAILNEIEPGRAARLTNTMAGAAAAAAERKKS